MATFRPNISPNIQFTETDQTFETQNFGVTSLGIAGEFKRGRAFEPIEVNTYDLHKSLFGGLDPCKFEGTEQPIYEGSYIAKQYLQEADQLFVTRILGLSGYDAGDAWGIQVGGALDTDSVTQTSSESFGVTINYNAGVVTNVTFTDSTLQDLYDAGEIDDSIFGGSDVSTGDTISLGNTFIGDCETFTGANFTATISERTETFICITGETSVSQNVEIPTVTQDCVVNYSGGTITSGSTFVITVENTIILQNVDTNVLTTIATGVVTIVGGTITHNSDGSINVETGTIYLPNGDVLTGDYKVCDLNDNDAVYDCDTIAGINFTITTGTTTIMQTVTTGITQEVVSQIPSGVVKVVASGTTNLLSGTPIAQYDNSLVYLLRSYASYVDEILNFNVTGNRISIESIDGGVIRPTDDFILKVIQDDGEIKEYNVSLSQEKANFIERVLGNFIPCCTDENPIYIEEGYQTAFQNMVDNGLIYCIKPTVCFTDQIGDYKQPYKGGETPWIVSELRGNRVYRLFRFHTFSDGNAANNEVKISITNIRPDSKTFDLQVRSYGDTDKRPTVLESYSRLTLRRNDNNFIGRRIGTVDGDHVLQSRYIMVEIGKDCSDESFPAGFEGYPVRDVDCYNSPQLFYKTQYNQFDRIRNEYLGFNSELGLDEDFFKYKGEPNDPNITEWTGRTSGFHMDSGATGVTVDGFGVVDFEVGEFPFRNVADLQGTDYERLIARKFTVVPYGGFDGWDIHRTRRTNTDLYTVSGTLGQKGLVSGAFDAYSSENIEDGTTVINSDYYAYLEGIRSFVNRDSIRINLLATPNVNTQENSNLYEEVIDMLEDERCDTFHVGTTLDTNDAGELITPQDIESSLEGLYDTNYSATYYPWGQLLDEENNVYVWLPPTAEIMRIFALTDKIAAPWFAGAGKNRGETQFRQARKKVTLSERDTLYDARVSPLATFREADGTSPVYVWGNRNLQVDASALDRSNVRRLILQIRRLIEDVSLNLIFDQNDEEVRRQFETLVNPILSNIREERGIFDFRVQVSRSDADLNSNALNCKIGIQPVRTLEFINVEFVLTPTGASFENI